MQPEPFNVWVSQLRAASNLDSEALELIWTALRNRAGSERAQLTVVEDIVAALQQVREERDSTEPE
jgi:hypothetical protein